MSMRVEVLNEVKTADPSPGGTWNLAFQWCRYVDDGTGSFYFGYRFIWRDKTGKLRPTRGQARLHSLRLIRDLLHKAESAGWGSHDADAVCDGNLDEPEFMAATSDTAAAGRTQPQGALALAGAWRELDDQAVDTLVEEIYATRRLDTGRPVELED